MMKGTGYSLTVMKAAKKFSKNIDKERNTDGSSSSLNSIGGKSCNSGSKINNSASKGLQVYFDRYVLKSPNKCILPYFPT